METPPTAGIWVASLAGIRVEEERLKVITAHAANYDVKFGGKEGRILCVDEGPIDERCILSDTLVLSRAHHVHAIVNFDEDVF